MILMVAGYVVVSQWPEAEGDEAKAPAIEVQKIPAIVMDSDSLRFESQEGMVYAGDLPFSGFAVKYHEGGFLAGWQKKWINGKVVCIR